MGVLRRLLRRARRGRSCITVVELDQPPARRAFTDVRLDEAGGPYACPCCGFVTLLERGAFEVCPVCFWEDDGQDEHDAELVRGGPNGPLSLVRARANYEDVGACDRQFLKHVRSPLADELPPG